MPTDSKLDLTYSTGGEAVPKLIPRAYAESPSVHESPLGYCHPTPARERAVEAARDGRVQLLRSGSGDDEAAGSLPSPSPLMPPSPASLSII